MHGYYQYKPRRPNSKSRRKRDFEFALEPAEAALRTVAHPCPVTIAAVERRGGYTFLVNSRIERELSNLGVALGAHPHHAVFRLEHGARTHRPALIVPLEHLLTSSRIHTIFDEHSSDNAYLRALVDS